MMKFKATDKQVQQIAVNAIKASTPVGMGFLHFDPGQEFPLSNIQIRDAVSMGANRRTVSIDYAGGRMVKLTMAQTDGVWSVVFPHDEPTADYQSWVRQYPTVKALLQSVSGVEII